MAYSFQPIRFSSRLIFFNDLKISVGTKIRPTEMYICLMVIVKNYHFAGFALCDILDVLKKILFCRLYWGVLFFDGVLLWVKKAGTGANLTQKSSCGNV